MGQRRHRRQSWASDDPRPGGWQYGRGLRSARARDYDLRQLERSSDALGCSLARERQPSCGLTLAAWTAGRPESWAHRLHRVSSDTELGGTPKHCCSGGRRWDGHPQIPHRPVGRIRVGFSSASTSSRALRAVGRQLPGSSRSSCRRNVVELQRDHGWFLPHPLDDLDVAAAMSEGGCSRGDSLLRPRGRGVCRATTTQGLGISRLLSYGDRYHSSCVARVVGEIAPVRRANRDLLRVDEFGFSSRRMEADHRHPHR